MKQIEAYPLTWPSGWKRITGGDRRYGRFGVAIQKFYGQGGATYKQIRSLTISEGVDRVQKSLDLLGITDDNVIISSNLMLRQNGLPRSGQPEPKDPGIAVYWKRKGKQEVMAADRYDRVADNLGAIAATLEALRSIDRHGGAQILDRAFTGFLELPAPQDWRHVLGFKETPTFIEAQSRFYKLAQTAHPDKGGSESRMKELNWAIAQAKSELQETV